MLNSILAYTSLMIHHSWLADVIGNVGRPSLWPLLKRESVGIIPPPLPQGITTKIPVQQHRKGSASRRKTEESDSNSSDCMHMAYKYAYIFCIAWDYRTVNVFYGFSTHSAYFQCIHATSGDMAWASLQVSSTVSWCSSLRIGFLFESLHVLLTFSAYLLPQAIWPELLCR